MKFGGIIIKTDENLPFDDVQFLFSPVLWKMYKM